MVNKKNNQIVKSFLIFMVVVGLSTTLVLIKKNLHQSQQSSSEYEVYQNPIYGFRIEYPKAWEIKTDTQVFENGDAIAFGISGSTQKKNTELTHGAQVAIAIPFTIKTDLITWIQEYFPPQAKLSKMTLTQTPYESVENCSHLGCMTYYFTMNNNQVNGVAIFAQGPDSEKMVYENATLYMLKSLKFSPEVDSMTKEEVIKKVQSLPEVKNYFIRVPNGLVSVNGEDDASYMVQVYENKDGHTATFNWYKVDKTTGKIEKEF